MNYCNPHRTRFRTARRAHRQRHRVITRQICCRLPTRNRHHTSTSSLRTACVSRSTNEPPPMPPPGPAPAQRMCPRFLSLARQKRNAPPASACTHTARPKMPMPPPPCCFCALDTSSSDFFTEESASERSLCARTCPSGQRAVNQRRLPRDDGGGGAAHAVSDFRALPRGKGAPCASRDGRTIHSDSRSAEGGTGGPSSLAARAG